MRKLLFIPTVYDLGETDPAVASSILSLRPINRTSYLNIADLVWGSIDREVTKLAEKWNGDFIKFKLYAQGIFEPRDALGLDRLHFLDAKSLMEDFYGGETYKSRGKILREALYLAGATPVVVEDPLLHKQFIEKLTETAPLIRAISPVLEGIPEFRAALGTAATPDRPVLEEIYGGLKRIHTILDSNWEEFTILRKKRDQHWDEVAPQIIDTDLGVAELGILMVGAVHRVIPNLPRDITANFISPEAATLWRLAGESQNVFTPDTEAKIRQASEGHSGGVESL